MYSAPRRSSSSRVSDSAAVDRAADPAHASSRSTNRASALRLGSNHERATRSDSSVRSTWGSRRSDSTMRQTRAPGRDRARSSSTKPCSASRSSCPLTVAGVSSSDRASARSVAGPPRCRRSRILPESGSARTPRARGSSARCRGGVRTVRRTSSQSSTSDGGRARPSSRWTRSSRDSSSRSDSIRSRTTARWRLRASGRPPAGSAASVDRICARDRPSRRSATIA